MNYKDVSFPIEKRMLTDGEVRNSMIILASLLRETDQTFRKEYLKGIPKRNNASKLWIR
jgi:hypothetical protein